MWLLFLASKDASTDCMAYVNIIRTPSGYDLLFDASFAKDGRLRVENNCARHTDTHYKILYRYA